VTVEEKLEGIEAVASWLAARAVSRDDKLDVLIRLAAKHEAAIANLER
jgi:hypothetical protein